jgi:tripartite-type tricarboxylate transporter receptor subunit TctC
MKKTCILGYCISLALSFMSVSALADSYPSKPIKAIVPFAPGSATDQIGRAFAAKMAESLGQPVVVENRPGANGMIGADVVAKSPADGYTLLFGTNSTNAALKSLVKNLPYNQDTAFTPIGYFGSVPLIVAVNNELPVKSLNGFVSLAKADPGKVTLHMQARPNVSPQKC